MKKIDFLNKNVNILKALINEVDYHSLELITGVSDETKVELNSLITYLEKRASYGERKSQTGKRKWTSKEDETLLTLLNEGYSISELSLALNRSNLAIKTRIAKLMVKTDK